jgi:ABC-type multidrug transport system ATPase subunit
MQGKELNKTVMVECRNLRKYYDDFKALDDLNLDIIKGEIFAFVGPT